MSDDETATRRYDNNIIVVGYGGHDTRTINNTTRHNVPRRSLFDLRRERGVTSISFRCLGKSFLIFFFSSLFTPGKRVLAGPLHFNSVWCDILVFLFFFLSFFPFQPDALGFFGGSSIRASVPLSTTLMVNKKYC